MKYLWLAMKCGNKYIYIYKNILRNKLPFGGVNIIAIGDLFQLQPVKSHFIFMGLQHNYGPLATNLWCNYFTLFELKEIMHQKDDQQFAKLLNRLCIGKQTNDDLRILQSGKLHKNSLKPYITYLISSLPEEK